MNTLKEKRAKFTLSKDGELVITIGNLVYNVEIYFQNATCDCYTVVVQGSVFAMSRNPFSTYGISQYCGERNELPVDLSHCGRKLKSWQTISNEVKQAILQRLD